MAKKMIIDYKNFDLEEIKARMNDVINHINDNATDDFVAYFGKEIIAKADRILFERGYLTYEEFTELFGVHFNMDMTGKMETLFGLSTSCLVNPYCLARMLNGENVCAYCFSAATQARYANVRENGIDNFLILNEVVIPTEYWPIMENDMLRGESFGDQYTWRQSANFNNFFARNTQANCALWMKNPWVMAEALAKGSVKPSNVQYIYSSLKVNSEESEIFEKYPFIDKVFTVFNDEYIEENGIEINCGARSCRGCGDCYHKGTCPYRRERLK